MEPAIERKHTAVYHAAAGALVVGHFIFLMCWFEPAIHQPDANGYFAQATRIAEHGRTWFRPESPIEYVGMHWLKTEDGRYFSHYPPGFPAVLAVVFKLGGPTASMLVNPLMCSLTLVGIYLLCAAWVGPGWGLLAAAMLAVNPTANNWALGYFAHTAAAFFMVWGIYFLARWHETTSWKWALAAGVFLGMLPSVRYPEGLFLAAGAVFALATALGRRGAWKSALAGAAGAAVSVVALAVHNHLAFGAFWRTGYSLTNEQTGFSWDYFTGNAVGYLEGLSGAGAGVLFGVGLAGIAALSVRRDTRGKGLLLAGLVVPVTVLYMSYYWSGGPRAAGNMRFLLPTFYVYALAGVWLLSMLGEGRLRAALGAGLALLAVNALWGVPESLDAVEGLRPPARALALVTRSLEQHAPPGSLVIASNAIQQHLDFVGRWRLVDESAMRGGYGERLLRRRLEVRDDSRPNPMQPEKLEERLKRYEGLEGIDRTRQFILDLWQWAGSERKVYWLVEEEQLKAFEGELPWDWPDKFRTVAQIELPKVEPRERRGGMFGGRPGGVAGRLGGAQPPPGDQPGMQPPDQMGMQPAGPPDRPGAQTPARPALDRIRNRRRALGGIPGGPGQLLAADKLLLVEWTAK